jgi:proteasome lid subunit RPN8/RPN11
MEFGVKKTIEPNEISNELVGKIYQSKNLQIGEKNNDFFTLEKLCDIFANRATLHTETTNKNFTCYIEKKAFDAFVRFANETYQNRHHEATGLIVGYYLHDKDNPNSKFIVGTNFLPAMGNTTGVTCEFSYQDSIEQSNYCNAHKLLPLVWIHSHPGFGAFYSGTDDFTLKSYFYANHQIGVVFDNIKGEGLGYKMYGDKRQEEDIFVFNLDKSNSNHLFVNQLNKKKKKDEPKPPVIDTEKNDDSKKKEEEIAEKTEEKTEEIKALETKVENLENEITTLKKRETVQRPTDNVIIWIMSVLLTFFLFEGVTLIVNCKITNDLEKNIVELQKRIDSFNDDSIMTTPTIDKVVITDTNEDAGTKLVKTKTPQTETNQK